MANSIGLDFGTGNSVLAYYEGRQTKIYTGFFEDGVNPSDIIITTDGQPEPDYALLASPQGYQLEKSIKRRLLNLDTESDNDRDRLIDMAVTRLKYVYDRFVTDTGEQPRKAILTCPANTGQAYRNVLVQIGQRVGLPEVEIVDEPTAAAVYHRHSVDAHKDERWLVVDWGCGTCDISLIERKQGKKDLHVVEVVGKNELGGMDMDDALRNHIASKYRLSADSCSLNEIEDIKKRLSDEDSVTTDLALNDGQQVTVTVTRDELEDLVTDMLEQFEDLVDEALDQAGWDNPDVVIATGGPVQMPVVRQSIMELTSFSDDQIFWNDPMTSVAQGAAALAEIKRLGDLHVTNKVAQTIGIRVVDGSNDNAFHPVIKRGESRPITREVRLATSENLQDIISIEILEGESHLANANTSLGNLNVVVRPENRGAIEVNLRIRLDESGTMEAVVEPVGSINEVRRVETAGISYRKGERRGLSDEARTGDPVTEFNDVVRNREVDLDTARQEYERIKIKYHPDRQPQQREHWQARIEALDIAFGAYKDELERRMRASTIPDLDALERSVIDETVAQRLTHCLANRLADDQDTASRMLTLLKRYPDYRRVVAAYLYLVKRNKVLQWILANDDRPTVGLVVLLQNLPGKDLMDRHEVLKAAYRLDEENRDRVCELLSDPNLDIEALYDIVRSEAPQAQAPFQSRTPSDNKNNQQTVGYTKLEFTYENGRTYITGNTYPVKEHLKSKGCRWHGQRKAWYINGRITEKDIWPDA